MRRAAVMMFAQALSLSPAVALAADVAAGQAEFNKCKICHTIEAGKPNTVGPNLHAVFGRKAGGLDNYTYSESLKNSGIVWDDETLAKYLRSPKEVAPDGKMAFPGIKDDAQIANLLAYLHEAAQ